MLDVKTSGKEKTCCCFQQFFENIDINIEELYIISAAAAFVALRPAVA